MRTTLFVFLIISAHALFSQNDEIIKAGDINKIVGDQWTGTCTWMNDSTMTSETTPVSLTVNADDKEPDTWYFNYTFSEKPAWNINLKMVISEKGDQINNERVSDRGVNAEGITKIITLKKSKGILSRSTYRFGENYFSVRREQKADDAESFSERVLYEFTRGK